MKSTFRSKITAIALFLFVLSFSFGCASKSADKVGDEATEVSAITAAPEVSAKIEVSAMAELSIEAIMVALTNPAYKGRPVGSAGNESAAAYISDWFSKIGLSPLKYDDFYWKYTQGVYDYDKNDAQMDILFKDGSKRSLVLGKEFSFTPTYGDIDFTLELSLDLEEKQRSNKIILLPDSSFIGNNDFTHMINPVETIQMNPGNKSLSQPSKFIYHITKSVINEIKWEDVSSVAISNTEHSSEKEEVNNVVGYFRGQIIKKR
ncbi:hypothetical protein FACS189490_09310 [Clostridia bacterium]|nr:hypothetical protein FACS189490_09310 [Clostridia bacterium]